MTDSDTRTRRQSDRVRKRAPNACTRCKKHKVRCSGVAPCDRCAKRNVPCVFNEDQQRVVVTKGFLTDLERQARQPRRETTGSSHESVHDGQQDGEPISPSRLDSGQDPAPPEEIDIDDDAQSTTGPDSRALSDADERLLTNPLISGSSTHTAYPSGRPSYLGTSSNWAFGRRILTMVYERVFGNPPPTSNLLFEGETYDLGWDGRRRTVDLDEIVLPTADFALFLINAVKFHCGQLFHLFDEETFIHNFSKFHENPDQIEDRYGRHNLWYTHYLLILALGKAFIVRAGKDRRPPGADLFVHAMKLLPDVTFLCTDPMQSIETLCCAALYLQCLDMRTAAYNLVGMAIRTAVVDGLHTDMQSPHHSQATIERCREIWWTVYVLDCHMASLMGVPLALNEQDITAKLPSFSGSTHKSLALSIHVKLAKITASILQTVYSKDGRMDDGFISSIKNALKSLADINDERSRAFPLDPNNMSSGVSRLSAYLHLFHHNCIILTTRPLLFNFWQRRLQRTRPRRVPSAGGVRSLLRVCVASAQTSIKILAALQAQSLLESFMPFDLETIWSSALALLVSSAVDTTLLHGDTSWLQTTHSILDEMVVRGNLIAKYRQDELHQMEASLDQLVLTPINFDPPLMPTHAGNHASDPEAWTVATQTGSVNSGGSFEPLPGWNSEDGLSSEQLTALADSLNFGDLEWFSCPAPLDHLDTTMPL